MADPFKLACGWCEFITTAPGDMVAHMLASGHGLAPGVAGDMVESGLPAELERVLSGLQDGSLKGEPVAEGDLDDEED
jgi:hypothetical protein